MRRPYSYVLLLLLATPWPGVGATNRILRLDGATSAMETAPVFYGVGKLSSFTAASWIYPTGSNGPGDQIIVERVVDRPWPGHGPHETGLNFRLAIDASGCPFVQYNGSGAFPASIVAKNASVYLPTNTWSHLCGSFDITLKTLTLYTNGIPIASTISSEKPWNGDVLPFTFFGVNVIGAHEQGVPVGTVTNLTSFFSGYIDEVQFWDGALSDTDIQAWMVAQPTAAQTNLLGYWSFDGGNGDDQSSSANGGSFSGNASTTPLFPIIAPQLAMLAHPTMSINFDTQGYVLYQLFSSTNLADITWASVGAPLIGQGGVTNLAVSPTSEKQGFYRILAK